MRKFKVEVANSDNWERRHRVITVSACTLNGAVRRAKRQMRHDEGIYQICTRIAGAELLQPIWDFFNGNMSSWYGLRL